MRGFDAHAGAARRSAGALRRAVDAAGGHRPQYVDRSALGIVAPALSKDLALTRVQMGELFAVFGLAHSIALLPAGVLADMLGSRVAYALSLVGWSLATLTQGLAHGYHMLLGSRLAMARSKRPRFRRTRAP
ncbi:MFS transporter [Burkholderia cenocepacia]|uniref:MFS transporter n=1 Tax=Burkholderia cenocepacia TaxID=95486 RepID=UPI000A84CAF0|nr:MFS transporter [Burkholderia cenocepacia]